MPFIKKKNKKKHKKKPHSRYNISRSKEKDWEKIYYQNMHQKKAEVSILVLDKEISEAMQMIRNREGHYKMIKRANPPRHNPKFTRIQSQNM